MSSLAPICALEGLKLPALVASPSGRAAPALKTRGFYRAPRPVANPVSVGSFSSRTESSGKPGMQSGGCRAEGGFVRPDCPSVFESMDEQHDFNLEDVDMAQLDYMKLKNTQGSKATVRSALEQASYMTNNALYTDEKKPAAGKSRFGIKLGR